MAINAVVFTAASLHECLSHGPSSAWFEHFECPLEDSWPVVSVVASQTRYVLDRAAELKTPS
jgi:hypothetical protein